ncbi:MarR family winged helix-turn-helix transcriptional regulator [Cardiobacterium valvarum]|uniref:Transcriptional repressor MprA n=1 Tax=Cardiobacterium valvarum TaxID=194702 RepID=A0A381ED31_9GAMM|nr:MarR family transcriptional regulator [Cardiobacterium valvarum]SUX24928.1 transcriptional repressor MprA [Cardiobacterium valvarum]
MNQEADSLLQLGSILTNIFSLYDRWAKEQGINPTTFSILYSLYPEETCTQSDICTLWGIAKQTISTQSNDLMDRGLLHIEQDNDNRRRKLLRLTDAGRDYARPFVEPLHRAEEKAFATLGLELGQQLLRGAAQFQSAFAAELAGSEAKED